MTGYQLTDVDLEFIKKVKGEQLVKKLQVGLGGDIVTVLLKAQCADTAGCSAGLQAELGDVEKLLRKETMALELACASKEKAGEELKKVSYSETQ